MSNIKIICQNKRARHEYFIEDTVEAGLVLHGPEVKSLREGKANLADSYASVENGQEKRSWAGDKKGPNSEKRLFLRRR